MNGAPPWYALAPEAGAVPCERGEEAPVRAYSDDEVRAYVAGVAAAVTS